MDKEKVAKRGERVGVASGTFKEIITCRKTGAKFNSVEAWAKYNKEEGHNSPGYLREFVESSKSRSVPSSKTLIEDLDEDEKGLKHNPKEPTADPSESANVKSTEAEAKALQQTVKAKGKAK